MLSVCWVVTQRKGAFGAFACRLQDGIWREINGGSELRCVYEYPKWLSRQGEGLAGEDKKAGKEAGRRVGRQAGREAGRQAGKQTCRYADMQTDRRTDRQADKQKKDRDRLAKQTEGQTAT